MLKMQNLVHVKTDDIYKDVADDVKTVKILNQTDHYLKEKIIGLMKDELGGKTMREFAELKAKKTYLNYLNYNSDENEKGKDTKSMT